MPSQAPSPPADGSSETFASCSDWGRVADVAELLAGEVTSNVVLHTRTPWLRLVAKVTDGTL